jgi:predicted metal-dependent hydrolase
MTRALKHGPLSIPYSLTFSARKTLAISVYPDESVKVTAPMGYSGESANDALKCRVRWILKQRRFFGRFVPRTPARRYVNGETHLYLGRQYRLRIISAEINVVKLTRGRIVLMTAKTSTPADRAVLLRRWYTARAHAKFADRLVAVFPAVKRLGATTPPALAVRDFSRRWGSLTASGRIALNWNLVRAPIACIDYVIVHELCHLVRADHSRTFFELLERIMPDWKERKTRLEKLLI